MDENCRKAENQFLFCLGVSVLTLLVLVVKLILILSE